MKEQLKIGVKNESQMCGNTRNSPENLSSHEDGRHTVTDSLLGLSCFSVHLTTDCTNSQEML